ncbi:integrase core domain-containing protein [Chitinivorax sp. B]|uniref:integrase core domain-containing protein n=1 Tax=Chitinivorax sp. B TaxID=2502235 RepID=UPI001485B84A|nr:integrase core domain-containing protein [Chitinivorax sp. B]
MGWQVFESERADLASQLLQDICVREGIRKDQPTLHADNGAPMKGEIMRATLQTLGVAHSRSRPAVSNDNPYSESLFKTLKYRPQFPAEPFMDVVQARRWVAEFEAWYNDNHRHSAIGFVTPSQRHAGNDRTLLTQRHEVYTRARQANPTHCAGPNRRVTGPISMKSISTQIRTNLGQQRPPRQNLTP